VRAARIACEARTGAGVSLKEPRNYMMLDIKEWVTGGRARGGDTFAVAVLAAPTMYTSSNWARGVVERFLVVGR